MDNTIVKDMTSQSIDKAAIKTFAVYARNKLINDIKNKAAMIGVTESGIQKPLSTSTGNLQLFDIGMQEPYRIEGKAIEQRNGLIRELEKRTQGSSYSIAYETLIEEVAYTWFNRIIAIRFMEVNNYMPDRMRVLSSGVEGVNEPEFITHVFESSFEFSAIEKEYIIDLKTKGSNLAMDELFQLLFIKQCNALNSNLPELFERTNDYTELLLTVSYNDVEGVIYKLVHDVPEANFDVNSDNGNGQVEIIGWMYQYYNSERKDEVINIIGKKIVKKQDIPAATQLFTTDWVVRYMVDNSLGKYWLERNPHSDLVDSLEYLISKDIEEVNEKISPEDIKFLDNCMGSGHILVYAFDVLMKIYESEGYTTREAASLIVEKNLFGLEIDKRSYQLSYFAIMMKARQYNRRVLNEELQNNLMVFKDSTSINQAHFQYLGTNLNNDNKKQAISQLNYLIEVFKNSEEIGSILKIEKDFDQELLLKFIQDYDEEGQITFETIDIEKTQRQLIGLVKTSQLLKCKYEIIVTNPPYLNKFDTSLKTYIKEEYKDYSGDLFSVFIYRNAQMIKKGGYSAYMAPNVWMFIKSYQRLREYIIKNKTIDSLIQMAKGAFYKEATVDVMTFVLKNKSTYQKGQYIRLDDFKGDMEFQKKKLLEIIENQKINHVYEVLQTDFNQIPGSPIAFWVEKEVYTAYENNLLGHYSSPKTGMTTGDNNRFLRFWFEVSREKVNYQANNREKAILSESKWFPYSKGGGFKRWYGFDYYIINWENDGWEIKNNIKTNGKKAASVRSENLYFKELVSWSSVTSANFSCRLTTQKGLFDSGGSSIDLTENKFYILALLNSKVAQYFLDITNSTINYQPGDISNVPVILEDVHEIEKLARNCFSIAENDWNIFETAPFFKRNILIKNNFKTIEESYRFSKDIINGNHLKMKESEEKINLLLINTYGLNQDLKEDLDDNQITISKIVDKKKELDQKNPFVLDREEIIKNFISYSIGCIFGRFSLSHEGLAYAGGEFNNSKYTDFSPSEDNVVFIAEEGYFTDDIVNRFEEFLRVVYGNETLEENLGFIANALGNKGNSSREVIRNYFLNDFYKDHLKTYQKRPIYWLYDSGKQNGFKALVYMHRYDEDTTGKVRVDYLHPVQRAYERTIVNLQDDIANSKDAKESTQLQKQLEKVTKQLKECRDYDERLGHMALERVAIDLDDGVKVNYDKVQTDSKGKFHQILATIK